jgi:hypothetical protein
MTGPTRVAGSGELADGSMVTWTVAEGRRGRRWREVVARDGATVHALLFETDAAGRFSHLELARADGLWTFHPEPDGTLHGNQVAADGEVRHVRGWPFARGDALVIEGSPIAAAALAWSHVTDVMPGATIELHGVVVGSDGRLERLESLQLERLDGSRWRVGEGTPVEVDEDGLPVLAKGRRRPLEEA